MQDFDLTSYGTLAQPDGMEVMTGREGSLIAISGRTSPSLPITSGGFLRLRVINASSSRFYNLRLDEHPFLLLGVDGGFLASPQERNDILLSPGERVDVVIRGTRSPGEYRLWNMPYSRTAGMGMGMMAFSSNRPMELAKLTYEYGDHPAWQVPERLTEIVPLPPPNNVRRFVLGQSMGGTGIGMGSGRRMMAFTINGRTFDMERTDTQVRLGDTEDWEFLNNTAMDHPMHVHTNPFQIVRTDDELELEWKDTVLVKAGQRVRVRTRFDDFRGLSVYHCHILDHEDMGMMGTLQIN